MARGFGIKKYYEFYENDKKVAEGTIDSVSDQTGIKMKTLRNYINIKQKSRGRRLIECGTVSQVFAFYKGENIIAEGSVNQIARQLDKSADNIRWYLNPSSQKRTGDALIILEGETVIEKRSATKHAPILTEEKFEPAVRKKTYIIKPVPLREFKFHNKWINYQLAGLFKGWN